MIASLNEGIASLEATLKRYRNHPELDGGPLLERHKAAIGPLVGDVENLRERHRTNGATSYLEDPTWDRLSDLFASRVGPPCTDEELDAIYVEGRERYEKKVPPDFAMQQSLSLADMVTSFYGNRSWHIRQGLTVL